MQYLCASSTIADLMMVFNAGHFICTTPLTVGLHQNRSLPVARWSLACRGRPIPGRCSLPSRPCAKSQAIVTCIAEVAPPKLGGFADVQSEAEFVAVLKAGVAAKKIPEQLVPGFLDFYNNYKSNDLLISLRLLEVYSRSVSWPTT